MLLKVGELAKRTGLTVRTLHHYDGIGLLRPSARSESGYRLYQRDDIARLHQIQALRRFGMSLADIGAFLDRPDTPFSAIVARQIAALERQIAQATRLRMQLTQLQRQLDRGEQPALADWLTTLELMTMYDKYLSKEELEQLAFHPESQRAGEWDALVAQMRALMDGGTPSDSEQVRQLACHWMTMLERDTKANPDVARRINLLMAQEPAAQHSTGITPELLRYVTAAFTAHKLTIYARYLDPDELAHMRAQSGQHTQDWLALIAAVQQQMDAGAAPGDAAMQALARQWLALFRSYAGDRPETRDKVRLALAQEPQLMLGTWMTDQMMAFIRQSIATLPAAGK
ncbi:MAG TPA: MerR family transcriptional regulator [Burkholderiaceae bacterium]|nr:MerR family transcriptional regulator [Burkholderiaceae bacterium]